MRRSLLSKTERRVYTQKPINDDRNIKKIVSDEWYDALALGHQVLLYCKTHAEPRASQIIMCVAIATKHRRIIRIIMNSPLVNSPSYPLFAIASAVIESKDLRTALFIRNQLLEVYEQTPIKTRLFRDHYGQPYTKAQSVVEFANGLLYHASQSECIPMMFLARKLGATDLRFAFERYVYGATAPLTMLWKWCLSQYTVFEIRSMAENMLQADVHPKIKKHIMKLMKDVE